MDCRADGGRDRGRGRLRPLVPASCPANVEARRLPPGHAGGRGHLSVHGARRKPAGHLSHGRDRRPDGLRRVRDLRRLPVPGRPDRGHRRRRQHAHRHAARGHVLRRPELRREVGDGAPRSPADRAARLRQHRRRHARHPARRSRGRADPAPRSLHVPAVRPSGRPAHGGQAAAQAPAPVLAAQVPR